VIYLTFVLRYPRRCCRTDGDIINLLGKMPKIIIAYLVIDSVYDFLHCEQMRAIESQKCKLPASTW
jgi:hypothetical protein